MVLNHFTFIADDPNFLNARPGSPHPFFYLISSASSSPDVWSNCIGGFAAGVASAHRRCLSTPALQTPVSIRDDAEAVDGVFGEQAPDRGFPTSQTQRRGSEAAALFGRVRGMAVDLLDTVGSYSSRLGSTKKGSRISILAFEVANTIFRGANLMESLSEESIRHFKEVVLPSEGVQRLVSGDMHELLKIAALDKKEELKVFLGEIVRYGNLCVDRQWHNLDRYFEKSFSQRQNKELEVRADTVMQQLMYLNQNTAELYYELQALDRLEQDYVHKLTNYETSNASYRGDRDNLSVLRADLKAQWKHARSLKRNSLWSRTLEEVVEQLVDITIFLHSEIDKVFGCDVIPTIADFDLANADFTDQRTLGSAGLALQYANVIIHINALVSCPCYVPPSTRDALYQGLPGHVQAALRRELRTFHVPEEFTISEIKEIMEDRLQWLVPMAAKTIKAHHTFSWLGEWANLVTNSNGKSADVIRIETLYHADIERTDLHILELLLGLHTLVARSRREDVGNETSARNAVCSSPPRPNLNSGTAVFDGVMMQRLRSSRSKKFGNAKARENKRRHRLATSSSVSTTTETNDPVAQIMDSDIDWIKVLDIIDGVCTI